MDYYPEVVSALTDAEVWKMDMSGLGMASWGTMKERDPLVSAIRPADPYDWQTSSHTIDTRELFHTRKRDLVAACIAHYVEYGQTTTKISSRG